MNGKVKKRRSSLVVFVGSLGIIGFSSGVLFLALLLATLPRPDILSHQFTGGSTKIFDRTGKVLLFEIGTRRLWTPKERIPETIKYATIAAEDAEFYKHRGVSLRGIIRSIWLNLKSRRFTQYGGSTITQQLARNLFLTSEKTLSRKIKEFLLALEIEQRYSKDEILTFYLNSINYGEGNFGVTVASEFYFGKPLDQLTLAEVAALVSIPKSPGLYSPYRNPQSLVSSRNAILERMARLGYITNAQHEQAHNEPLHVLPQRLGKILAPHFVIEVKTLLEEMFLRADLATAGFSVVTTLDYELQRIAEEETRAGALSNEKKYNGKNAALLALSVHTGEILAMVGSRDFFDRSVDGEVNLTMRPRQPGSAFKPLIYLTLFEKGYPDHAVLFDLPTNFATTETPYRPLNFDKRFRGPVTLREALAQSINVPSVKVLYLTGIDTVLKKANQLGIPLSKNQTFYGLSLGLGTAEVRMIDLVRAYTVFPREGSVAAPFFIKEIRNQEREIIYRGEPSSVQVADDEEAARMITDILSDDEARSPLFGSDSLLNIPGHMTAVKTGTSQDFKDAWVVGYSPSLITAVWAGNNNNAPMKPGAGGILAAVPIWHRFMTRALSNAPDESFVSPNPRFVDKPMLNGQYVIDEEVHSILHYVDKNNPLGSPPQFPEQDPQHSNWEEPVRQWWESRQGTAGG